MSNTITPPLTHIAAVQRECGLSEITVKNGMNQDAVAIFINVYSDKCS
jgi:hypothetical protein